MRQTNVPDVLSRPLNYFQPEKEIWELPVSSEEKLLLFSLLNNGLHPHGEVMIDVEALANAFICSLSEIDLMIENLINEGVLELWVVMGGDSIYRIFPGRWWEDREDVKAAEAARKLERKRRSEETPVTLAKRSQISRSKRFAILTRDGFRCCYCGATPKESQLHVDHVIPVSKGGGNDESNLKTACEACNLGKGARA